MRRTSEMEIEAVLALDGPARFDHFVKRVADSEVAWGLWRGDGWVLMANDDGKQVFPMWPAREYAQLHCTQDWAGSEVRQIPLTELVGELLPKLEQRGILPGVFPTPSGRGPTPAPATLADALRKESQRYA